MNDINTRLQDLGGSLSSSDAESFAQKKFLLFLCCCIHVLRNCKCETKASKKEIVAFAQSSTVEERAYTLKNLKAVVSSSFEKI